MHDRPGQNLGDLGVDGEVAVKIRTPYVRGALAKARSAMRQTRRRVTETRFAPEVKRTEQQRTSSPSEMLGDPSPKSRGLQPPTDHNVKKEKPHKPRVQRVSITASPLENVYMETEKVDESPALDLICAEEDGFVQLAKVSEGTFRYETRLANGRRVEKFFDIFAENQADAEDDTTERQSKDVKKSEEKKGKISKKESAMVADAVLKPSAQLRGNMGWAIELYPSPSEMWRRKVDPRTAERRSR